MKALTWQLKLSFLKILASDGLILNFFWGGDTGGQKFQWGRPPATLEPPLDISVSAHKSARKTKLVIVDTDFTYSRMTSLLLFLWVLLIQINWLIDWLLILAVLRHTEIHILITRFHVYFTLIDKTMFSLLLSTDCTNLVHISVTLPCCFSDGHNPTTTTSHVTRCWIAKSLCKFRRTCFIMSICADRYVDGLRMWTVLVPLLLMMLMLL